MNQPGPNRSKNLLKFTFYKEMDFGRNNPINQGIPTDQPVTTANSQVLFRYIKYQGPQSGNEYERVNSLQVEKSIYQ